MPGPESTLPADWLVQGDQDLEAAEILLNQNGPLPIVAFLQIFLQLVNIHGVPSLMTRAKVTSSLAL